MDHLTVNQPLTAGGEWTFELITHYLPILIDNLICGEKTGP